LALDPRLAGAVLTVDLAAIAANYRLLAARVAPAECAAVVKADAYGLGVDRVAPALAAAGARTFFVAHLCEALALRERLPGPAIGVLNGLTEGGEDLYVAHRLIPVLNHLGEIARWAAQARRCDAALPAIVHVDTGMNRLGLGPDELDRLAAEPDRLDGPSVRAIMSHLACADEAHHPKTPEQRSAFAAALARLPPAPASLANSSGIFRGRAYHFDLVRPGLALYGANPTPDTANPMQPTIRVSSGVIQIRHVDSPMTVGYGATHRIRGKSKIATLPVGYADGYHRCLSGRGRVWIAGCAAPVVGRISMDLMTVDVTHLPDGAVAPGTPATILGGPGCSVDEVAAAADTIPYEILTSLGRRYARRYVGDGG